MASDNAPTRCHVCEEELTGSSHYHCPNCWERCSMMGHWDPKTKDYSCEKKPHPNPSSEEPKSPAMPTNPQARKITDRILRDFVVAQAFDTRDEMVKAIADSLAGVTEERIANDDQWYLQDTRQYVGNSMLWWAAEGGYLCDIHKAAVFTREDAFKQHASRDSDRPWPKAYIDARIANHIDMQYCEYAKAMALPSPPPTPHGDER